MTGNISVDVRDSAKPILENEAASLWDIGHGIACFEIHTKLNSFAPQVFEVLEPALDKVQSDFAGLVLGNDDPRAFSAGADLRAFLGMIEARDWQGLNAYIARGQDLFLRMKYTPYPVVAAAHGLALGGGCEFLLNANAIVAHAELNSGLPETKVGIIPGWGGGTQLLQRAAQSHAGSDAPLADATAVFDLIARAAVSTSALDARDLGMLVPSDRIVMNREHLLFEARAHAAELAKTYQAPERARITVTGKPGYLSLMSAVQARKADGQATDADVAIAEVLATALTGGTAPPMAAIPEEEMMRLEREGCIDLARLPATTARIKHMLETGKPLRN